MFPKRRKPTHPGEILQEEFLKPLHMDAKKFASVLGGNWSELKVSAIISGAEGVSDQTAHEFAEALGTTIEFWKRLGQYYHQWQQTEKTNEKGSLKPWKKAQ